MIKTVHNPAWAHDECGVAFVARLDADPRHEVIERALVALDRLEHRGAAGADESTGDGAGILITLPHGFFSERAVEAGVVEGELPGEGRLAVGVCFMPRDDELRDRFRTRLETLVTEGGQRVLGWREVPVDESSAGRIGLAAAPRILQLLIGAGESVADGDEFERRLFVIRRRAEIEFGSEASFPSFSSRTVVYKGMLTASQLDRFYPDLTDPELVSPLAIVHSRFSTNTAPSWELAQPLRTLAHNGEINTALGNVNWMRAREQVLASDLIGPELADCLPVIADGASDSAAFDRTLELLVLAGRPITEAMMMMVPPVLDNRDDLAPELEGFYRYHSRLMEPWDGPAALAFSDGRMVGAMLDRNGLRPGRWLVTRDGWVVCGSEAGIFSVEPAKVQRKGRLRPGALFVVDLEQGRVFSQGEVEAEIAAAEPFAEWDREHTTRLDELSDPPPATAETLPLAQRQLAFGYSQEDLRVLLAPLASAAGEPTGSMGNDLALAVFSEQRPSLFTYFKQRFAQVTNPAIDSVREQMVMSLTTRIGPEGNVLSDEPDISDQVELEHPILTDAALARLRRSPDTPVSSETVDITWPLAEGEAGLEAALERISEHAQAAAMNGAGLIVLSDRALGPDRVAIPALLAIGAVHQSMVRAGSRLGTSLVVESGEPREIHHLAALISYGASAVNPYLMLESIGALTDVIVDGQAISGTDAVERAIAGMRKGLLKVLSKMGISTIHSYRGAQIFEAVGLDDELVDAHFTGTPSRLGGIGTTELAREALDRHARAWPEEHGLALPEHVERGLLPADHEKLLPQGGVYRWRRDGERHMWDPETVASLQRAVRDADGGARSYAEFSRLVNEENASHALLRGLLRLKPGGEPIAIDEVDPAAEIVKRFSTGGMSLGALSPEAHETLAVAMNRIDGHSNSGEGGEDRRRNTPDPNGDQRRSRIRQIASGRFGVDIDYLSRADQIQIKIAQGAKPGEGGQLPGHKVDAYIAKLRFSTPGVELISPPPHHDIYSIEDLKQLIYDLRMANPRALVSVKLAAEAGVGTIAAGVVKAGADHIVIAGHDGGTGASPLSSIQSTGVPWELGLAEAQQMLIDSDLRSRVLLQADGQMRTGRDIVIAALLGADEVGLSTAPLIATGCIMMRVCHLNTCPVGIASQDPVLRERFEGTPEHVVNYMFHVAEEVRGLMASLGLRHFTDLIGRTDLLEPDSSRSNWKTAHLDLHPLLAVPESAAPGPHRFTTPPVRTAVRDSFDKRVLCPAAGPALERGEHVRIEADVTNEDLAVGGLLSSEIAGRKGLEGLPDGTIEIHLKGSAGQSAGAWLAPGVSITIAGEVNDYAGKGLSGGTLAVHHDLSSDIDVDANVIAGNVTLYGATGGKAFFAGFAGERFAVRNSGALAVVEGIGEHGCEYMTGGCVVVLGSTGYNFAAGMSGGVAYVWDPDGNLRGRCNHQMVDLDPLSAAGAGDLRRLVEEHHDRTHSAVAEHLLGRWKVALEEFTLVIPRGYKAALADRENLHPVAV